MKRPSSTDVIAAVMYCAGALCPSPTSTTSALLSPSWAARPGASSQTYPSVKRRWQWPEFMPPELSKALGAPWGGTPQGLPPHHAPARRAKSFGTRELHNSPGRPAPVAQWQSCRFQVGGLRVRIAPGALLDNQE